MEDIEDEEITCSIKMSDVNYTKIIEIIACKLVVDMARFYDQKPLNTTVITELVLSDGYGSSQNYMTLQFEELKRNEIIEEETEEDTETETDDQDGTNNN